MALPEAVIEQTLQHLREYAPLAGEREREVLLAIETIEREGGFRPRKRERPDDAA